MSSVRDFYEGMYSQEWRKGVHDDRFTKMWYKAFLEHVLPTFSRKGKALEVGAGYGYLAHALTQHGLEYTATDISEAALAQIPRSEVCNCQIASVESLPFEDDSFDLVLCMEVLEHVEDPRRGIQECFRVARPGALLVFSIPTYFNAYLLLKKLADWGAGWCRRYMVWQIVDRTFMPWTLDSCLRQYGNIISKRAVRIAPPFWEQLDRCLRVVNNMIFRLEGRLGATFPVSWLGLHTMIIVTKR